MSSGRFSKQAVFIGAKLNASAFYDSAIGGTLATSPSGQSPTYRATLAGDRVIFSPLDALANSNTAVGNLYTGTYRYVSMRNNSTSAPTFGHAAFWDTTAIAGNAGTPTIDSRYQVTSDEPPSLLFAGVFLNSFAVSANNNFSWWIQESGKTTVKFRTAITGTPTAGAGVYLTAGGNNANTADVGSFDQVAGSATSATQAIVDNMIVRFVGQAEVAPTNNNTSLVDLTLSKASYRW